MTQLVPIVSTVVQQFDTLETRRKLGAKCVPQLFLESLLGTRRSAIRDFKIQQRGRQRERQKNNWFSLQNNNFARASHFFTHFFPDFARLRRENA